MQSQNHDAFDFLVLGAGPAGSVCALLLARLGWKVALVAGKEKEQPRVETLPPESNALFRSLDIADALEVSNPLCSPGIISYWGTPHPVAQDFLSNPYGMGWHVDRSKLDSELRRCASNAGVTLLSPQSTSRDCRGTAMIVDATGRNGTFLNFPAARRIEDVLLVLVVRIANATGRSNDLRSVIAAAPNGWWYWAPVGPGNSIAMFFTDREQYQHLRLVPPSACSQGLPVISERLAAGSILDSRWTYASSSIRKTICAHNWMAIGDSASSYDPLAGQGIYKAIQHASIGARALNSFRRGDSDALVSYEKQVRREFDHYAAQRKAYYALERRWSENSFWQGRQT